MMQLRICDLRNAKYQGETVNREPQGFGFVLDENYTFVASQWTKGSIDGPGLAIFGDSVKMFSDQIDNKDKLLVYSNAECKIYSRGTLLVVDCMSTKMLLKLEGQFDTRLPNERRYEQPRVSVQRKYSTQNYLSVLKQLLQIKEVPFRYQSYQNYIKEVFKSRYRNLVNIFESSKEFCLSFFQDGLFVKINKEIERVQSVGSSGINKKVEISRKYNYLMDGSTTIIEQFVNSDPVKLFKYQMCDYNFKSDNQILAKPKDMGAQGPQRQKVKTRKQTVLNNYQNSSQWNENNRSYEKGRPIQCVKVLRQYYKRSLTFSNKYISIDRFYDIKRYLDKCYPHIKKLDGGRYAQIQLQNNGYQLDQNDQPIITAYNQVRPMEATIEDWRKELGRTTNGKSKKKAVVPERQEIKPQVVTYVESPYRQKKIIPQMEQTTKNKNREEEMNDYPLYRTPKIDQFEKSRSVNPAQQLRKTNYRQPVRVDQNQKSSTKPGGKKIKYLSDSDQQQKTLRYNKQGKNPKENRLSTATFVKASKSKSPRPIKFKYFDDTEDDNSSHQIDRTPNKNRKNYYNY